MADGVRVLYVDDEPSLLEIAQIFLEQNGEFSVETATSARKALDSSSIQSYDVVISDYQMPGMDGIAFLKEVRERFGDIPFILFTGKGREEVVIDAINHGADFYLQKGGDVEAQFAELAHKIRQATRRRETEQELQKSEERYRSIVNDQTEMIVRFTPDGRVTFSNEAYRLYFDPILGLEKVVEKNIHDLMQIPNYGEVENFLSSFTPEAPIHDMERTVTGKDGKTYWQHWTVRALFDGDRKPAEYQVVGRDISEQKRSSAALADSEARLRSFIETTRESVTLVNEEGKVLEWNAGAERITGIRKEEALGSYLWDLTFRMLPREHHTEERRALIEQRIRTSLETGIPVFEEPQVIEAEGPDGSRIYTRQTIFPIKTDKGFGIGSISQDITKEKLAENAIRESEKKYHDLAELLPQVVFEVDTVGNLTYTNHIAFQYFGYSEDDFRQGLNVMQMLVPGDVERAAAAFRALVEGTEMMAGVSNEYTALRKDHSTFPISIYPAPIIVNGRITGLRGVIVDITKRKRAEEALRESEERFRGMTERSSDLILVLNKEMSPVYVSPSARPMLGFAPEELVGKPPEFAMATIFSETGPALMNAVTATKSGLPVENVELQLYRKDKTPVIVSLFAVPVLHDGILEGVQVSMRDITEHVVTQSALQAIVGSMVGTTGPHSLRKIAENVSSWLGADCVMVGEIQPDHDTVKVLSMILDGKQVNDFIYHLKGTPCENVAEKGFCHYPDDAIRLFPESKDLVELNILGYIGTPLKNSDGKVIGILCALFRHPFPSSPKVQEIMAIIAVKAGAEIERSQMERALRESEEKFRSFVENANEIIFSLTPDGIFTYVSPNWTEWLGHDTGEVIGKNAADFVHPDDFLQNREVFLQTLATGKKTSGTEYRVWHKDGSWRWQSQSISPIRNTEGRVVGIQGISHDITDRKRAEEALARSEELYRILAEESPDQIFINSRDGTISYVNTAALKVFHGTYDQVVGKSRKDVFPPQINDEYERNLRKVFDTGEPVHAEDAIQVGSVKLWIDTNLVPLKDNAGNVTSVLGIARDITERKRAEEALRQAHNKLHLLSGITRHDISNQLLTLNGFVALLQRGIQDPVQKKYFSRIMEASSNITDMIAFTKEYEKIGTGAPVWQDLTTVITTAGKGIIPGQFTLKNDLPATTDVFADPMLEKVFFNLLDNAVRHGERVTEIHVSSRQSEENLVIVWEDNGIGIAADEKERIFERGFGKNTGLGMFLVREILSLTGITIKETGEPSKGARFEMVIAKGGYRLSDVQVIP